MEYIALAVVLIYVIGGIQIPYSTYRGVLRITISYYSQLKNQLLPSANIFVIVTIRMLKMCMWKYHTQTIQMILTLCVSVSAN